MTHFTRSQAKNVPQQPMGFQLNSDDMLTDAQVGFYADNKPDAPKLPTVTADGMPMNIAPFKLKRETTSVGGGGEEWRTVPIPEPEDMQDEEKKGETLASMQAAGRLHELAANVFNCHDETHPLAGFFKECVQACKSGEYAIVDEQGRYIQVNGDAYGNPTGMVVREFPASLEHPTPPFPANNDGLQPFVIDGSSAPSGYFFAEGHPKYCPVSKRNKRSRDHSEEPDAAPRKARVLMTPDDAKGCVDENRCFILKKNAKGQFNSYKLRTFVATVRRDPVLAKLFVSDESEIKAVDQETGTILSLPVHGRGSKRTPGLAKARARSILDKLRKHSVIGGRYVSVLRDFGYGGNSAHAIVKEYTAEAAALAEEQEEKEEGLEARPNLTVVDMVE